MEALAERIKEAMRWENMTRSEFERCIGVGHSVVGDWFNGKTMPSCAKIIKIADLLGVSIDWLLGRVDCDNEKAQDDEYF